MRDIDQAESHDSNPLGQWIEEKQIQFKPKLSDAELARRVGITRQHLGAIKRGESGTKKPVVISIANALNADPNEICEVAGFKGIRPDEPDIQLARRLEFILRGLPLPQRRKVEEQLEKDAAQYVSLLSA